MIFLLLLLLNPLAGGSCNYCHSNATLMEDSPGFMVSNQEVWNQSNMFRQGLGGPGCPDCHLGNSSSYRKEEAHEGMLTLKVLGKHNGLSVLNRSFYPEVKNYSSFAPTSLIPGNSSVKTVLWHDRGRGYAFNSTTANRTCGKCHPQSLKDFLTTPMARAGFQSQYPNFTYPDPHNCGYWLVNYSSIAGQVTVNYSRAQASLNNRVCQQCHTSCLDCHYNPQSGKEHSFSRSPSAQTCYYGGGRGICHLGAEQYRRGSGYFRSAVSAGTMEDDTHAREGLACTGCHTFDRHNISRQATCQDCHLLEERQLHKSSHQNLSCESCHVTRAGGYQLTFWAPGEYYGQRTPLAKLNSYGMLDKLLLIQDDEGEWIPTKPMPQAVFNLKGSVEPSEELEFREIPGLRNSSRDAYYLTGTYNLSGTRALTWVHMDKVSHGFGKARDCKSCHQGEQRLSAYWYYPGEHTGEGTAFSGASEVIANSTGLYFEVYNTTPVGGDIKYLAPWLGGVTWEAEGDFSLPQKSPYCITRECSTCHLSSHRTINPIYQKSAILIVFALGIFAFLISALAIKYFRTGRGKI